MDSNGKSEQQRSLVVPDSSGTGVPPQPKVSSIEDSKKNKRERYLAALGLREDPFLLWVAENEINEQIAKGNYRNPLFYSFFTPVYNQRGVPIPIRYLRQERHHIIYGNPGAGKTSLRLWLELECRLIPNNTLVVTYTPGEGELQPHTEEEHDRQMAQSFVSDLIIQIIEQLDSLHYEEMPIAPLAAFITAFPEISRAVEGMIAEIQQQADANKNAVAIEQHWHRLGRYAVQPVPYSETRAAFLQRLAQALKQSSSFEFEKNKERAFTRVLSAASLAHAWGFERVYLLLDGVDNRETKAEEMFNSLRPLLNAIQAFTKQRIYYKMFLPRQIRRAVDRHLSQLKNELKNELFPTISRDTIVWRPNSLKNVIVERFRAAGAPYISSLNELADEEIKGELEEAVIRMANRSPRRLVEIISRLIDNHLRNREQPEENLFFTKQDLVRTQEEMEPKRRPLNP